MRVSDKFLLEIKNPLGQHSSVTSTMPADSYGFNNPTYDGIDGEGYIDVAGDAGAASKKGGFILPLLFSATRTIRAE